MKHRLAARLALVTLLLLLANADAASTAARRRARRSRTPSRSRSSSCCSAASALAAAWQAAIANYFISHGWSWAPWGTPFFYKQTGYVLVRGSTPATATYVSLFDHRAASTVVPLVAVWGSSVLLRYEPDQVG